MKKLTDSDIEQMAADEFRPGDAHDARTVRMELHLSKRIPPPPTPTPTHARLDLHQHTIEQAWNAIMNLATSGVRDATIITGASGVLKQLFPQWTNDSILAPYVISATPINNGSFAVKFRRKKS